MAASMQPDRAGDAVGVRRRADARHQARRAGDRHAQRRARVLIAAESPVRRAEISRAVELGTASVRARAADVHAVLAAAHSCHPDIALVDADLSGSALVAARALQSLEPSVLVVLLDAPDDDQMLFAALRAGIVGYLLDTFDLAQLPRVLDAVLLGEISMPRALMTRVALGLVSYLQAEHTREHAVLAQLSSRQWEVLGLLADGATTAEIADALYVSQVTVRSHVAAITRKLGVPDRDAAVLFLRGVEGNQRRDTWTIDRPVVYR
ncbi:MAG TPA: response regulator transcription factor [Acidimicrobiia bacterium]|nr:response regulator transcription factor [Acidimicrobiia bacterium]